MGKPKGIAARIARHGIVALALLSWTGQSWTSTQGSAAECDGRAKRFSHDKAPRFRNWSEGRKRSYREARKGGPVEEWGWLEIPALRLRVPVLAELSDRSLDLAVAIVAGTPDELERGQIAIAGHRDSFFRTLGDLEPDAEIRVYTREWYFVYAVRSRQIVSPTRIDVLEDAEPSITLITCYPFYYEGHAPLRYVVKGRLVERCRIRGSPDAGTVSSAFAK